MGNKEGREKSQGKGRSVKRWGEGEVREGRLNRDGRGRRKGIREEGVRDGSERLGNKRERGGGGERGREGEVGRAKGSE